MADTWKNVYIEWQEKQMFIGHNETGASVQIGSLVDKPGIGPMEMLLLGLAGCTGMDIVSILEKQRQEIAEFQVRVRGLRSGDYPMVYKAIEVEYILWGERLSTEAIERAIELSEQKYCSVGIMLGKTAEIHSTYRVLPPGSTIAEK